jgi:hypothetical protein
MVLGCLLRSLGQVYHWGYPGIQTAEEGSHAQPVQTGWRPYHSTVSAVLSYGVPTCSACSILSGECRTQRYILSVSRSLKGMKVLAVMTLRQISQGITKYESLKQAGQVKHASSQYFVRVPAEETNGEIHTSSVSGKARLYDQGRSKNWKAFWSLPLFPREDG